MKSRSQKDIILEHLRASQGRWLPAYHLRSTHTPYGWIGHQGDRICRKLAEDGIIERTLIGKYAHYRAKQPTRYQIYRVPDIGKEIRVPIYD